MSASIPNRGRLVPIALLALAGGAGAAGLGPVNVSGDGVELRCTQPDALRLECDYRLLPPGTVQAATASIAGRALPDPELEPPASGSSAVLLLVDTSDPRRHEAVGRAVEHLGAILAAGDDRREFGLATFDSSIRILAPLGTPVAEIERRARAIEAIGKTTELYRSAIEAVRLLASHPAERRALFIFSDGLAEDRAYFHADVVAAAHEAGVVIYGIGYPRSTALSVALQSLRRLAEETGGLFLDTGARFELPAGFLDDPFAALDSGGRLGLSLEAAVQAGLGGGQRMHLLLEGAGRQASAEVPVALPPLPAPEPVVKVVEVPRLVEVPVAAPRPPPAPAPLRLAGIELPRAGLGWLLAGGAALLVVLAALLAAMVVRRRRHGAAPGVPTPPAALSTYAYLELQDGSGIRHPVTSVAYRIGRHADNDLVLKDPSISRHHAEIHRRRDGSFTITDLDSLNGVFVNDKKLRTSPLKEGDLLEVGDVTLRFGTRTESDVPGEETVILRTVRPREPQIDDPLGDTLGDALADPTDSPERSSGAAQ